MPVARTINGGITLGQLLLLRHAKAAWAEPGMKDFDRMLDDTGMQEALEIGRAMKAAGLLPQTVICSAAVRARQTLEQVNQTLKLEDRTQFTAELYASDAPGYLDIAASAGDSESVLLVGHNPMLEDLALGLSGDGDEDAVDTLQMGFRTAGLAVISFDGPASSFEDGKGRVTAFLTP